MKINIILCLLLSTTLFGCISSSSSDMSDMTNDELQATALEKNNIAYCDQIRATYVQNDCYINLALKYQNPSYCSKINDPYPGTKENCKSAIKTTSPQSIVPTVESDKVVLVPQTTNHTASILDDIERCENITHKYEKEDCLSTVALEWNNIAICNRIISSDGTCISNIAAKYNNSQYCYQIRTLFTDEDQSRCLRQFNN